MGFFSELFDSITETGKTITVPGTSVSEKFEYIHPKYTVGASVGKYLIKGYCDDCNNWGYHILDKFKDVDRQDGSRGHTVCCNCGAFTKNIQIDADFCDSGLCKKFDKSQHDTRRSFFDSNIYKRPSDEFLNAINIYNSKKDSDHLPRYKLLSPPGRYLRSGWCYYTNQWTDYEVEITKSANSIFTDDCVFGREDNTGIMIVTCLELKKLSDKIKVNFPSDIPIGKTYGWDDPINFFDARPSHYKYDSKIHTFEVKTSDRRFAPTISHPDKIFDRFKETWNQRNISGKNILENMLKESESQKLKNKPRKKSFFEEDVTEYKTGGMDSNKNKETSTKKDNMDVISQIEKLAELRDKSIITEEEFQKKKTELLDSIGK